MKLGMLICVPSWPDFPLRAALADALLPRACAACERAANGPFCAACAETLSPTPPGSVGSFVYAGALATAVRHAKRGDFTRARALAELWSDALATGPSDAVTFVPAPWQRLVRRGFDLPAVLAQAVALRHGVPLLNTLRVVRHDAPLSQGASRAERQVFVKGRFVARTPLAAHRLLVIDDVTTTGATLHEALAVLAAAGAEPVARALAATADSTGAPR
jgi:predicted amidophosphoribosyltransferase